MGLPDLTLGPEWALLELLVIGRDDAEAETLFLELIRSEQLHWGEVLHQSLRHGILPLLAFNLVQDKYEKAVPTEIVGHLHQVLNSNRHRIAVFRNHAARIARALRDRNIRFVGTKGISLESSLYGANGSRHMLDIDFMIMPGDRDVVTEIMTGLGYAAGTYDLRTDRVSPPGRKDVIVHRLNPDHLMLFTVRTDDRVVRNVLVDVANSLTWTNCPFDVPLEHAFAEIRYQPIPGHTDVQLPVFGPNFQFLFTILHLFREAWLEKWIELAKDVNLSKFADVIRLWRTDGHDMMRAGFRKQLVDLEAVQPVLWVLEHLDRTFGMEIVKAIGLEGDTSDDWLFSARASGGALRRWPGTMRQRLHCKDRRKLFADLAEASRG